MRPLHGPDLEFSGKQNYYVQRVENERKHRSRTKYSEQKKRELSRPSTQVLLSATLDIMNVQKHPMLLIDSFLLHPGPLLAFQTKLCMHSGIAYAVQVPGQALSYSDYCRYLALYLISLNWYEGAE